MAAEPITRPPHFDTEGEEAQWWDAHPEFVLEELKRARAQGSLGFGTALRLAAEKQTACGPTIRRDLSLATSQAQRKGLAFQAYIQGLIHEAIQREDGTT